MSASLARPAAAAPSGRRLFIGCHRPAVRDRRKATLAPQTAARPLPPLRALGGLGSADYDDEAPSPTLGGRDRAWWVVTVAVAAATAVVVPFDVAFGDAPSFYGSPLTTPAVWIEASLACVWAADAALAFRRAASDAAAPREAAARLALDALAFVPVDAVAVVVAGGVDGAGEALPMLALFRLLSLLRLHRVRSAFAALEYDTRLDLLWITIARNATLVLFAAHVAACGFYFAAARSGFAADALPGADAAFLTSLTGASQRYWVSLFWALTTLTSAEYGNPAPATLPATEAAAARAALFLAFQVALWAYILGTTTLLVVRDDERTGRFRDRSARLRDFTTRANVPPALAESMDSHLRLHFALEEADDESVLAIYPTALRRRVLRHLYGGALRSAYLFAGTPRRFRDAVLAEARLELFLPGVEILAYGDAVNEMHLIVRGRAESRSPLAGGAGATTDSADGGAPAAPTAGVRQLGVGDLCGELAFFTEEPQASSVTSTTTVRVLTIQRGSLDSTLRAFPAAARTVLANLQRRAEALVEAEFGGQASMDPALRAQLRASPSSLSAGAAAAARRRMDERAGLRAGTARAPSPAPAVPARSPPPAVSRAARAALADLVRVKAAVSALAAKAEEERTTRLLYAAERGSMPALRSILSEGVDPNAADYDGRTALMLASSRGHAGVVEALLAAGADPCRGDALGGCALSEACVAGHDAVIDSLVRAGGSLASTAVARPAAGRAARAADADVAAAALLCAAVHAGDAPLLRRLVRAGAPLDAADWDDRRALHVAASDGSATITRLLVDAGASTGVADRWGATPLDEAAAVGAGPVIDYLRSVGAPEGRGGRRLQAR